MAKKIRIYYRAPSHVPLWKVMEEAGFLEKHGLEMEMGSLEGQRKRAAEGLKAGDLDVVSGNHHNLYARKVDAKIVEVPPMAMIEGVTLTTTTTYVNKHEDECRSLIMALIDGTHFFKTKKADTLAIIKKHCSQLLKMHDDQEWNCFYDT